MVTKQNQHIERNTDGYIEFKFGGYKAMMEVIDAIAVHLLTIYDADTIAAFRENDTHGSDVYVEFRIAVAKGLAQFSNVKFNQTQVIEICRAVSITFDRFRLN